MGQIPTLLESFNFKRVTLHFLCLIHSEIGPKSKTFALDKNIVFFLYRVDEKRTFIRLYIVGKVTEDY